MTCLKRLQDLKNKKMKIKKNGKVITLTESDLKRIVKKTLSEQASEYKHGSKFDERIEVKLKNLEQISSNGVSLRFLDEVLKGVSSELYQIVDMLNSLPEEDKEKKDAAMLRVDKLLTSFKTTIKQHKYME